MCRKFDLSIIKHCNIIFLSTRKENKNDNHNDDDEENEDHLVIWCSKELMRQRENRNRVFLYTHCVLYASEGKKIFRCVILLPLWQYRSKKYVYYFSCISRCDTHTRTYTHIYWIWNHIFVLSSRSYYNRRQLVLSFLLKILLFFVCAKNEMMMRHKLGLLVFVEKLESIIEIQHLFGAIKELTSGNSNKNLSLPLCLCRYKWSSHSHYKNPYKTIYKNVEIIFYFNIFFSLSIVCALLNMILYYIFFLGELKVCEI